MRLKTAAILAAVFLSAGCRPKPAPAPKPRGAVGGPARLDGANVVNAQGEILVMGLRGRTTSPGGKWLIGAERDPVTDTVRVVLVQMTEGRLEATLSLPADAAFAGARWSPREDRLLVLRGGGVWLVEVDAPKANFRLEEGAITEVWSGTRATLPENAWAPDGRAAAFIVEGDGWRLQEVVPGRPPQVRGAAVSEFERTSLKWTDAGPVFP